MTNHNTPADQTIYGAFGEFDAFDVTADWTDEEWANYDAWVDEELAAYDDDLADEYVDLDYFGEDR
jgi:hypothetical protein